MDKVTVNDMVSFPSKLLQSIKDFGFLIFLGILAIIVLVVVLVAVFSGKKEGMEIPPASGGYSNDVEEAMTRMRKADVNPECQFNRIYTRTVP